MRARRIAIFVALAALFLLHNDFWLWHQPRLVLGLPIGFVYHILYCLAVAGCMALVVRFVKPEEFSG